MEDAAELFDRFDGLIPGPFTDLGGFEFQIGDVVFFEFNWKGRTIPRRGRITKINTVKRKIKVLSNSSGGYAESQETDPGVPSRMFSSKFWREFWIGEDACPQIIGGKNDRIIDC